MLERFDKVYSECGPRAKTSCTSLVDENKVCKMSLVYLFEIKTKIMFDKVGLY